MRPSKADKASRPTATTTAVDQASLPRYTVPGESLKVAMFDDWTATLSTLPVTANPQQRAKQLVLQCLRAEVHKYRECHGVVTADEDPLDQRALTAYRKLCGSNDWVTPALVDIVTACAHHVRRKPYDSSWPILLHLEACQIYGQLAGPGHFFEVSRLRTPFRPAFDRLMQQRHYLDRMVDTFACRLESARKIHNITCLAFAEKAFGKVGAIFLAERLGAALNLPITVYREAHYLAGREKFVGYHPTPHDNVAFIYDTLATGSGVVSSANQLVTYYGAKVPVAVVLFAYSSERARELIDHSSCAIEALATYPDIAEELEEARHALSRSEPIPSNRITHWHDANSRRTPPPVLGTGVDSSDTGGTMNQSPGTEAKRRSRARSAQHAPQRAEEEEMGRTLVLELADALMDRGLVEELVEVLRTRRSLPAIPERSNARDAILQRIGSFAIDLASFDLKQLRQSFNLTVQAFSEITGIPPTTLARYERGETSPSLAVARDICERLQQRFRPDASGATATAR